MLDHVSLRVVDYDRSKAFYREALASLGYKLLMESASGTGFSRELIPDFWIKQGPLAGVGAAVGPSRALDLHACGGPSVHVAFASADRSTVDAFYRAAMSAGVRDNSAPGLRPDYHPTYYGAFVLDPDGYNIEAVCHRPEGGPLDDDPTFELVP